MHLNHGCSFERHIKQTNIKIRHFVTEGVSLTLYSEVILVGGVGGAPQILVKIT